MDIDEDALEMRKAYIKRAMSETKYEKETNSVMRSFVFEYTQKTLRNGAKSVDIRYMRAQSHVFFMLPNDEK